MPIEQGAVGWAVNPATTRPDTGARFKVGLRIIACALVAVILVSCTGPGPTPTPFRLPSFHVPSVYELLQEAIAETGSGALATPATLALPPSLTDLMLQNRIEVRPLPLQANQICQAMGVPRADDVAGQGLLSILQRFRPLSDDLRSSIGLLVTVAFTSCDAWIPIIESAIRNLF